MKKKWKPMYGDEFYLPEIDAGGFYRKIRWSNHLYDKANYRRGLVCKTKKEATAIAKAMLDFIKHIQEK